MMNNSVLVAKAIDVSPAADATIESTNNAGGSCERATGDEDIPLSTIQL
jgi:hypothetical protein